MSVVDVAVAIIEDAEQRILITQRAHHIPHGGLWEFPGGKFEPEETPLEALKREIGEEVGLQIKQASALGKVRHAYPEKEVCLHIFKVEDYTGAATCNDGQLDLRWVNPHEFHTFTFPEANHEIMRFIFEVSD